MPALAVHHTETTDEAWDGPANEARLRADESESYYRSAFAWQDPDGNPETKAAYKFIHHMVDGEGNVGPANTRACSTGIGVLNGGRGGTTIPSGDRRGVWRHLGAHLEDADMEVPDLRAHAPAGMERRTFPLREIRVAGTGEARRIEGYAAVFDALSVPLWGFRERIKPGAFAKTIQEADIRALWNHDPNYVFGRNRAETLQLTEDEIGLGVKVWPPPRATWAKDFMVSIERGDVDQMSFAFEAIQEQWHTENGETIRELREVKLSDVSFVTFPAYPQTVAQLRDVLHAEFHEVVAALLDLKAGTLTPESRKICERFVKATEEELRVGPAGGGHLTDGLDPEQVRARLARMRRRLELLEI